MASDPIHANRVKSWDEFIITKNGLLILNGDSSFLPIPDASIDAVITDPPYFDYVHYSELSDFFFAWLKPVLESRYPYFNRPDSSDDGEVQHKDPQIFSKQLTSVLSECRRVLKDEGILAFSFHHSRAEGWAAIYEAINTAGLSVVASHPVHAEMRAASPKSAAKNPISLDAILVCKKKNYQPKRLFDQKSIIQHTETLTGRLVMAGMCISTADRFVIAASQALIAASTEEMSFDMIKDRLESLYVAIHA